MGPVSTSPPGVVLLVPPGVLQQQEGWARLSFERSTVGFKLPKLPEGGQAILDQRLRGQHGSWNE